MTQELDAQKLVVDAVNTSGTGRAMKYKDQFLSGPADLLIKLRHYPAFFLEAKFRRLSVKTTELVWDPDVTRLQRDFLKHWHEAGMDTGVVSFVQDTHGNVNSLRMAVYSYLDMACRGWYVDLAHHQPLGDHRNRNANIIKQLDHFVGEQDETHR